MKTLTEYIQESIVDMDPDANFESVEMKAEYKRLMDFIKTGNFHRDRGAIDNGDVYYHYGLIYAPQMFGFAGLNSNDAKGAHMSIDISQSWIIAPKQGVQIVITITAGKNNYGKTFKLDPYKYAKISECVKYIKKELFKDPVTAIETISGVINNKEKWSREIL